MNKIKQILAGLALIVIGILSTKIDNDATAAMLLIPIGTYAIFSKEEVFNFGSRKKL